MIVLGWIPSCAFLLQVSVFHKPLERETQCAERRDSLMQLLYQTLFLCIVSFINSKISTHRNMWSHFMGKFFVHHSKFSFSTTSGMLLSYFIDSTSTSSFVSHTIFYMIQPLTVDMASITYENMKKMYNSNLFQESWTYMDLKLLRRIA